jgi:hypothetical protein
MMMVPPGVLQQQVGGAGLREYASIAAAEASGDPWVDGEEIIITGLGDLSMIYYTALENDGHSGLIHAFPFGDATTHSAASVTCSEAGNTDPDAWTGFNDTGTGSKGTDYEYDTDSGLARVRTITATGQGAIQFGTPPSSGETFAFGVFDDLSVTGGHYGQILLPVYHNGSVVKLCVLRGGATFSTEPNWNILNGSASSVDTGIPRATGQRLWLYANSATGDVSVWTDTSATPDVVDTIFTTGANYGLRYMAVVGGSAKSTNVGYFVNASLTVA